MQIYYSPKFARMYKKLPKHIKQKAHVACDLFQKDPFHPSLKTHKLTGPLKGRWAFSLTTDYRIIFTFEKNDQIHFHTVGDHSIYR